MAWLSLLFFLSPMLFASEKLFIYPFPSEDLRDVGYSCAARKPQPLSPREYEALFLKNCTVLEAALSKVIFGQDIAIKSVSNAITRYTAGVSDTARPIATMLFCGPSGVGKTELAQQLGRMLYGEAKNIICLNMSEYSEPHSISRLIGSPPGYLGSDQGGQLSDAILRQPYSIILLDEVEKAHPQILKLFLHIFDNGLFNSAKGEHINCKKCIFIMTSNLAASDIVRMYNDGVYYDDILQQITPHLIENLSPELFNRIEPVLFLPLSDSVIDSLVVKLLEQIKERAYNNKKIHLSYDQSLIDFFKKSGIDPLLGVRPLKRLIDKELTTLIAKAIVEGKCKENDTLHCLYQDGYIIIEKR
jgi:ATP-dependent Clp protease ATP-binding subunit ClpB